MTNRGYHNSLHCYHLKMMTMVFEASLCNLASASAYPRSEYRQDIAVMRRRAVCEGVSFFTKTLPRLGKALDRALSQGCKLHPEGFGLKGGLPKFLRTLFARIFDADGWERSDASPDAVRSLRQLLLVFYKYALPSTSKQNNETIESFIQTDISLTQKYQISEDREPRSSRDLRRSVVAPQSGCSADRVDHTSDESGDCAREWILGHARRLVWRVFGPIDPVRHGAFHPKHGPGSVSTGEKPFEKPKFTRCYTDLVSIFNWEDWFFYNYSHLADTIQSGWAPEDLKSGTAKVVLVPKDSRGPRLISCEPLEYQWIQQGLMSVLVSTLESHPFTRGQVNILDQTVNRRLAYLGSQGHPWVTLDMKEASDRVSLSLVEALFPPLWVRALKACRTPRTLLPDGRIHTMNKFAPMGSAVCFPIEATIFWALAVSAIAYTQPERKLNSILGSVYVYGDDIIVRSQDHASVLKYLPMFELVFNVDKCCTAGFFRESCGLDAYKGVDVTPLRIKSVWCPSLRGTVHASYVEYHNSFIERGMFHTADLINSQIQRIKRTPYSDNLGAECVSLVDPRKTASQHNKSLGIRTRFNPRLHRREVYGWKVRSRVIQHTGQLGWNEMLRVASLRGFQAPRSGSCIREERCESSLRWNGNIPSGFSDVVTAYQYALPRQATLRRGWASI